MTSLNTVKRPDQSFYSIQALRFLAALLVVLAHASFIIGESYDASFPHFELGSSGVNLFFAISGFVMVLSSQKLVGMKNGWRVFVVNRLIRIVPLYWLLTTAKIVLLLGASTFFIARTDADLPNIIKSYLFLPSLNKENFYRPIVGVGWSLNLEMFFYLIFAACLFLRLQRVLTASLILVALALLPLLSLDTWQVISFYTDTIMLNFIWGMVIAVIYAKGFQINTVAASLGGILGLVYLLFPEVFGLSKEVSFVLSNVSVFGVLLAAVTLEDGLKRFIPYVVRFFGDASYSLYLVHTSVLPIAPLMLKKLGMYNSVAALLGSVVISLIASALLYIYVENPMTQKLKTLTQNANKT